MGVFTIVLIVAIVLIVLFFMLAVLAVGGVLLYLYLKKNAAQTPEPPKEKVCTGCGITLTDDVAFCPSCGTKYQA